MGDDANLPLLRLLAQNNGLLENVLSTEPVEAKLNSFLAHGSAQPVAGLRLDVAPAGAVHTMYPLDDAGVCGVVAAWVGDYLTPAKGVTMTASADAWRQAAEVRRRLSICRWSHWSIRTCRGCGRRRG